MIVCVYLYVQLFVHKTVTFMEIKLRVFRKLFIF